jgi:hypothetical protein
MNSKKLIACLAGLVMLATTGTALAEDGEGGLGDQKKVEGAGLSHQGKTVGKYGSKLKGARARQSRGMQKAQQGISGMRRRGGKRPTMKQRSRMLRGARKTIKGKRQEKRAIKKGTRRGKRRPRVMKPRPTRKQAVDNLKKDLLIE